MARIKSYEYRKPQFKIYLSLAIEYESASNSRSDSFFFIRIPDLYIELIDDVKMSSLVRSWYKRGTSYNAACGADERSAINAFEKYMDHYLNAGIKTEKVILYKFCYDGFGFSSSPKEKDCWDKDIDNGEVDLKYQYKVCEKKTFGGKTVYYDLSEVNPKNREVTTSTKDVTGGYNDWIELPYTEEVELFFKEVYLGMENLCKKFTQFLGTKKVVIKTLKDKQKLLA